MGDAACRGAKRTAPCAADRSVPPAAHFPAMRANPIPQSRMGRIPSHLPPFVRYSYIAYPTSRTASTVSG